ncbi:MAG: GIY-YIG nuclease family protein [Dehalococcoidia bacterium]
MTDRAGRKELAAGYKATRPLAGVYRFVNTRTGRFLLASTTNLTSMQNKAAFARSTASAAVPDQRLAPDIREFGIETFAFEVLESVEVSHETTPGALAIDLAALLALWQERLAGEPHY